MGERNENRSYTLWFCYAISVEIVKGHVLGGQGVSISALLATAQSRHPRVVVGISIESVGI